MIIFNFFLMKLQTNNESRLCYKHFAYNSLKHDIICNKVKYSRYTNLQKKLIYLEYWWKLILKKKSNIYIVSVPIIYKII